MISSRSLESRSERSLFVIIDSTVSVTYRAISASFMLGERASS